MPEKINSSDPYNRSSLLDVLTHQTIYYYGQERAQLEGLKADNTQYLPRLFCPEDFLLYQQAAEGLGAVDVLSVEPDYWGRLFKNGKTQKELQSIKRWAEKDDEVFAVIIFSSASPDEDQKRFYDRVEKLKAERNNQHEREIVRTSGNPFSAYCEI